MASFTTKGSLNAFVNLIAEENSQLRLRREGTGKLHRGLLFVRNEATQLLFIALECFLLLACRPAKLARKYVG